MKTLTKRWHKGRDRPWGQGEWKPAMAMTETTSSWRDGWYSRKVKNLWGISWKPGFASFSWLCRWPTYHNAQNAVVDCSKIWTTCWLYIVYCFLKDSSKCLESLYNFLIYLASLGQDHKQIKHLSSRWGRKRFGTVCSGWHGPYIKWSVLCSC